MRRRALLAAVAATATATAGCSVLDSDDRRTRTFGVDDTETPPTTPYEQPTPTTVQRSFVVPGRYDDHVVAATVPDDIPEGVAITLGFSAPVSRNSPAKLYVRLLRPEGREGAVDLPVGPTPPLSGYRGSAENADRDLLLVPERAGTTRSDVATRERGCWRPRSGAAPEATTDTLVLEPGESIAHEYHLVTPRSSDSCLHEGAFRFRADAGWSFHVASYTIDPPDGSRYADAPLPDLPGRPTRYYHETDIKSRLYLEPSAERLELPAATASVRLHNYLDRSVPVDAGTWTLSKFVDGEWYRVAPLVDADDVQTVLPGGSTTLSLSLHGDPDAPADGDRTAVGGLGEGTYAVAYPELRPAVALDDAIEGGATRAALLELVGPTATLDASDAVHHVAERDGVYHVYTTADESSVATLRVDRASGADPETRLLTEQVLQREALRNALAELRGATDADAVVYHADASAVERATALVDPDADGLAFRHDDATYRTTYG